MIVVKKSRIPGHRFGSIMKNKGFFQVFAGLAIMLVLLLGYYLWPLIAFNPEPRDAPSFEKGTLILKRSDGKSFSYAIEIAKTEQQEMYGLMFRHSLAADAGMIFVYPTDEYISMWMKNTYIPLDMLFVRHDGIIVTITTHAKPLDLTPLSSGEPVRAVIELNAGDVEKNGFKTGDKVLFPGLSDTP